MACGVDMQCVAVCGLGCAAGLWHAQAHAVPHTARTHAPARTRSPPRPSDELHRALAASETAHQLLQQQHAQALGRASALERGLEEQRAEYERQVHALQGAAGRAGAPLQQRGPMLRGAAPARCTSMGLHHNPRGQWRAGAAARLRAWAATAVCTHTPPPPVTTTTTTTMHAGELAVYQQQAAELERKLLAARSRAAQPAGAEGAQVQVRACVWGGGGPASVACQRCASGEGRPVVRQRQGLLAAAHYWRALCLLPCPPWAAPCAARTPCHILPLCPGCPGAGGARGEAEC